MYEILYQVGNTWNIFAWMMYLRETPKQRLIFGEKTLFQSPQFWLKPTKQRKYHFHDPFTQVCLKWIPQVMTSWLCFHLENQVFKPLDLPSGNLTYLFKHAPLVRCFTHKRWWYSIFFVCLPVYQRVGCFPSIYNFKCASLLHLRSTRWCPIVS